MPTRTPKYWWRTYSPIAFALAPLGYLYGRAARRRMRRTGTGVSVPVVCVGNLVAGGAGKTPTALALAELGRQSGFRIGFLSRGYLGCERGPILVSKTAHSVAEVGDEAFLLAAAAPTVVSVDRLAGAKLLARLGVDLIIMDDGFQNPSLVKDLSLVVIDAGRGIGNGRVLPAGPLRAPLFDQIRRADAIIILGSGPGDQSVRAAARAGLPVIRARLEPVRKRGFRRSPYLAFAGLANPAKFYETLRSAGAQVSETRDFPDHHAFTDAECEALVKRCRENNLVPITTDKDRVRLAGRTGPAAELATLCETFPVRVVFEEPKRVVSLIEGVVAGHQDVLRRPPPQPERLMESSRRSEASAST